MYIESRTTRLRLTRIVVSFMLVLLFVAYPVQAETFVDMFGELFGLSISEQPDESSQQNQIIPQSLGMRIDKSSYFQTETIVFTDTVPESSVVVYYLDDPSTVNNPDPDSKPTNVLAAMTGIDGSLQFEAVMIQPGEYIFINTTDSGHCGTDYLVHCRLREGYQREVAVTIY
ncbi:MAG: hypothetical protein KBD73_02465 [Candidatus Magasanikbacteria bacterium]|nr:hypothetical protein [Candidatus Magasanikbacteria bacterium]